MGTKDLHKRLKNMFPNYTKAGQPLKASWANDVVSSLRSSDAIGRATQFSINRNYKPFDVVALERIADDWYITLKEAYYFPTPTSERQDINFGSAKLQDYVKQKVQKNQNLYFDP